MIIKELRGLKSVRIYQLYQQTLIGLALMPTSRAKDIKSFLGEFETKDKDEKREMLRNAVMTYRYDDDDIRSLLDFVLDERTKIEYSQLAGGLSPNEIVEAMAEVLLQCSEIRVFFWTPTNQKKSQTGQSD
jgi:hypothetical protein